MITRRIHIATTIADRVSSMMRRIALAYLKVRGMSVKACRRIDWGYPGYQLAWRFGSSDYEYGTYIASFGLVKVIKQPVEGAAYLPREHYKGFTFSAFVGFQYNALMRVQLKFPHRLYEFTAIPRVYVRLWV